MDDTTQGAGGETAAQLNRPEGRAPRAPHPEAEVMRELREDVGVPRESNLDGRPDAAVSREAPGAGVATDVEAEASVQEVAGGLDTADAQEDGDAAAGAGAAGDAPEPDSDWPPAVPEEASDAAGAPDEDATVDSVLGVEDDASEAVPAPGAPPGVPGVVDDRLKGIVEALVFASPEPMTPKVLFKLLEQEPREDVEAALEAVKDDYARHPGLQLVEVAGGYQIVTRPELHDWVRRLFHERKTQKLSVQALETLAVIAYKQPITAPEIAEIRGVNTSGVLNTLLERHLVKIAGRKPVVGRPFLYATTREFLIRFGLRDLNDLPKMEDMADVLGFEARLGLADTGPSPGTLPLE